MQREDVERWTAILGHVGEHPLTAEVVLASDYAALLDRAEKAEAERDQAIALMDRAVEAMKRSAEARERLTTERDAALARPSAPETLAWAVVGEDGVIRPDVITATKQEAALITLDDEHLVRVAIRRVDE